MKSVFMQLATAFQRVLPRRFVRQAEQYYFDDEVIIVSSDNVEEVWDFDDQEIYYLPYDEWQLRSQGKRKKNETVICCGKPCDYKDSNG